MHLHQQHFSALRRQRQKSCSARSTPLFSRGCFIAAPGLALRFFATLPEVL